MGLEIRERHVVVPDVAGHGALSARLLVDARDRHHLGGDAFHLIKTIQSHNFSSLSGKGVQALSNTLRPATPGLVIDHVEQLVLRDLERILFDHHHVGELARFQGAQLGLLADGDRDVLGEHADRFVRGDLLLRMAAALRIALQVLSGDGSVDAVPRVEILHRAVGAAGQDQAFVDVGLPLIGVGRSLRADSVLDPVQVGAVEGRLDVDDHRQLAHALDQLRSRHLGVDDAERVTGGLLALGHAVLPALRQGVLDGGEDRVEAGIADAVGRRLQTHLVGLEHLFIQSVLGLDEDARGGRIVIVRLEQRRGAGAEGTVGEDLVAAVLHQAVRVFHFLLGQIWFGVIGIEIDADTERQFARSLQRLVIIKVFRVLPDVRRVGVDLGHALSGRLGQRGVHQLGFDLRDLRRVRDDLVKDLRCLLSEDTVRVAVLVELHQAADAELVVLADARDFQCLGIGDRGVQADSLHEDRVLGADRVQIRLRRDLVLAVRPLGLVEIVASDPLARRSLRSLVRQHLHGFLLALGCAQVDGGQGLAIREEVQVGVAQARKHRPAAQVHDLAGLDVRRVLMV